RPRHAGAGGQRRRAARKTSGCSAGPHPHRPWRPDGAALHAGLQTRRVRRMIRLETPRLILRNWEERDRDLFHRINCDDEVMRFFPFRRTRAESDAFMDTLHADNETRGYVFCALEVRETGQSIGIAGLHPGAVTPTRP